MFIQSRTVVQPNSPRVLVVMHVIAVASLQSGDRFDRSPTGPQSA